MVMRWDSSVNDYAFDVALDEANGIGRAWGPTNFDAMVELQRHSAPK